MNNTHKLLLAFIDAMGFEVETNEDIKHFYSADDMCNGKLKENAFPDSIIKTTDYKVTKKSFMLGVIDEWKDLTDCEKLMALKKEIKRLQEVPCEKT